MFLSSAFGLIILPTANLSANRFLTIELSQEKLGREASVFVAALGNWSIGTAENNKKALVVDHTKWRNGGPSAVGLWRAGTF
jgi:hypothetical protein